MKQFIETICILDGLPRHLQWHQRRVDATLTHFYPVHKHTWLLDECVDVPHQFQTGKVKCRIIYDAHLFSVHYYHYDPLPVSGLQLTEIPLSFEYGYKYADRMLIEKLTEKCEKGEDVLLSKNGFMTDTSIANIAFQKNGRWYTPSIPLLAGTTWKRLVAEGVLIPSPIHRTMLNEFETCRLFNAMNDWDEVQDIPVQNIIDLKDMSRK
jgi:4-amino-4-deoxychorismate lyase